MIIGAQRLLAWLPLAAGLAACLPQLPVRVPILTLGYPAGPRTDTVVVMLPGIRDRARVFERERFVAAFQRRGLPVDIIAVEAHLGYYVDGSLVRRLHEDVVGPALEHYRHVIFVGVSLGAYGAIRYTMSHPEGVDAIVLLSPFLGPFMRRLAAAGDDDFNETWDWLKGTTHPRILLGYGHGDAFLASDIALAAVLPRGDVVTVAGIHWWITWRALLSRMLDGGLVPVARARAAQ